MIGIVIICHRQMATYLKDAADNILGKKEYFESIDVFPQDGIEGTKVKIQAIFDKWKNVSEVNEILFFVDMFGGTPCNSVAKFFSNKEYKFDVITGVNLPMVLTALTARLSEKKLDVIVENIIQQNQKAVLNLKKLDIFKG